MFATTLQHLAKVLNWRLIASLVASPIVLRYTVSSEAIPVSHCRRKREGQKIGNESKMATPALVVTESTTFAAYRSLCRAFSSTQCVEPWNVVQLLGFVYLVLDAPTNLFRSCQFQFHRQLACFDGRNERIGDSDKYYQRHSRRRALSLATSPVSAIVIWAAGWPR
ncbi:hypothetical protein GGR57DRAFT_330777 [Xylariaceae sp. FL1272]|nr:hypothetical protein GGR57DRAFT_330777 [Xylariaceae sp. FL1272]